MSSIKNLNNILKYLNVNSNEAEINMEQLGRTIFENKKISALNSLIKRSKSDISHNSCRDSEIEAEVNQWIEYAIMYVVPASKDKQLISCSLKDFDAYLHNRSYLVGQFLSLADLVNFYALFDMMKSLNLMEKEKLLNLSRWFDHLQQDQNIRQELDLLNFTVLQLHGWASGTHL